MAYGPMPSYGNWGSNPNAGPTFYPADYDNNARGGGSGQKNPGYKKPAAPKPKTSYAQTMPGIVAGPSPDMMYSQGAQQQQQVAAHQMTPLSTYLSQVPPLQIPTIESQNQLQALSRQNASVNPLLERMVGNSGIQAGSGVNMMKLANPMMAAYRHGAQGAAELGLEDQLARDKHLLGGMVGLGGADFGLQRANLGYKQVGLDAQNNYINQLVSLMGGMGQMFS